MKTSLRHTLLASSFLGLAALATSSALARPHWHDDQRGAISTSPETGGYCDSAGCPDHFWRFPIHYGPVFFRGQWYRGPVYFRGDRWGREYWVSGGWHRDEWRGRRSWWAQQSHDGPPLPFEYYADHGFQVGGHWRREHDADYGGDRYDRHGQDNGDWHGRDGGDHHNDGNGDGSRGDNGGWHPSDNGPPNNDQGRNWDNGGRRDGAGPNDQRGANTNTGQGQAPAGNVIHVTSATYGASCHQPAGNVTKFLSDACNGKGICEYTVQYQAIGDPAPGCAKDFSVQWTCSMGPGGTASAAAEAGLGSKVSLQCQGH